MAESLKLLIVAIVVLSNVGQDRAIGVRSIRKGVILVDFQKKQQKKSLPQRWRAE